MSKDNPAFEKENLIAIERGFWHEGSEYYQKHISETATFVFPGMTLAKADGVAAADLAPRWDELKIDKEKVIELSDNIVILTYHAGGKRAGKEPYAGNITTIYQMEEGSPKMVFHQHTPDP